MWGIQKYHACFINIQLDNIVWHLFTILFHEIIHAVWILLLLQQSASCGCEPETLTHRCSACESWTESSQHRGKLRAIARCAHSKVTHQQNSSLPPQDSNLVCSGHAFQENYNGVVCNLWGICGAQFCSSQFITHFIPENNK